MFLPTWCACVRVFSCSREREREEKSRGIQTSFPTPRRLLPPMQSPPIWRLGDIVSNLSWVWEKNCLWKVLGGKKKRYYLRCKSLKVTNPDFSNRLGESGLFGRLGTQCVTEKFQKPRVKQESLWLLGKIKVKGSYSFVLNSLEFRKTEHSRNQDSTVRTMDGKLKRMAFGVALSYVNFKWTITSPIMAPDHHYLCTKTVREDNITLAIHLPKNST